MTRILGIDPGSRITGFGVIDVHKGEISHVHSGCLKVQGEDLAQRLRSIFEQVNQVVAQHRPSEMAIERVFVQRNADSALKLGQARGAAICAVVMESVPVFEYSAREIKQATVGRGGAAKEQVQHMVTLLLKMRTPPPTDAADALACALCHCHTQQTLARMAGTNAVGGGVLR